MDSQKLTNSKIPSNVNEKVEIYEERGEYMHMNNQEEDGVEERLDFELRKPKYNDLEKDEEEKSLFDEIQNTFKRGKINRDMEEKYIKNKT